MSKSSKNKKPGWKVPKGLPIKAPRLLLVIDPAAAAGVCLFVDGKLVESTPADGSSFMSLLTVVQPVLAKYTDIPKSDRVVVLEQHWMSFFSQKGSMTLGQRRGIAQSVGEAVGCQRWYYVPAATWQAWAFGGHVEDTKKSSLERASKRFERAFPTDDCSDAANIGDFFLQECVK